MPLGENDVLVALSDPVLRKMDFRIDNVHVRGEGYKKIYDLIDDQQILVVEGNDPNEANYNSGSDTLTTQKASSPADLWNRSVLIHECTHAIADMEHARITWLTNEAAARIAQSAYLLLSIPNPPIPPAWKSFMSTAMALAKKFNLHTTAGVGAKLTQDDVGPLVRKIDREKAYHRERSSISVTNGISKKDHKRLKLRLPSHEDVSADIRYHPMNAYRVPTDALFDFGKFNIKPEAEPALNEAAAYIKEFLGPGQRVYITGHTDSKGGTAANMTLSKQRAQAVAQWLTSRGKVDASRVITTGEGEAKPVVPNQRPNGADDPDGRARNRRVEILIL